MSARTIIVIEDNLDFATILETILGLLGYTVHHYDTVAAGAARIGHQAPALLILDGQLPDGEGFTLYQRLRRDPLTRRLPILLLSVSDEVYQQARAASDQDPYLHVGLKPMPIDQIQTVVERVIHT